MKTITDIKSGAHLGVVRKFIQRKCVNGDRVMWGSTESVGELTVADLELLAQDIRNAVVKEIDQKFALPHTVIELKIARIEKFLQGLDSKAIHN